MNAAHFISTLLLFSSTSLDSHIVFGTPARKELNPDSIRVLVWNIKKGQEKGLDIDLPLYGKNKDLLILSEGLLSPPVKSIFNSIPDFRWDMGMTFLSGRNETEYPTGTMIASKVDPSLIKVRLTKDVEPVIHTPKALTIGRYPVQGHRKDLLVISVHGINIVKFGAFFRHMNMIANEIKAYDGPVLLAGDFNSNTEAKIEYLMILANTLGLRPISFRNDERMTTMGHTIDHIFVRGLEVRDSEVLGKLKSSDHKAMLAEFFLN